MDFRSYLVFREMYDIHKEADVGAILCMARFCYEKLGFYNEGQNLSKLALGTEAAKARPWLGARCHVYIAVGFTLLVTLLFRQSNYSLSNMLNNITLGFLSLTSQLVKWALTS